MLLLAAWQMSGACGSLPDLNYACKALARHLDAFHAGLGARSATRFKSSVHNDDMMRKDPLPLSHANGTSS